MSKKSDVLNLTVFITFAYYNLIHTMIYTAGYHIHNDALVSNSLFCGLNISSHCQQLMIGLSCRDGAGLCLVVLKRSTVPSPWQRY